MTVVAITNVSENVGRIISLLSPKDRKIEIEENGKLLAARNLLGTLAEYNNENLIYFISPYEIDPAFIKYAKEITGFTGECKNILNIFPDKHDGFVSTDILHSQYFETLAGLKEFKLTAYSCSTELNELIAALREKGVRVTLDNLVEYSDEVVKPGTKNGLRDLLKGEHDKGSYLDVEMAPGTIFHNNLEGAVNHAAEKLRKKGIVLKVPDGHAGLGVEIIGTNFIYKYAPKFVTKALIKRRMRHNIWNNKSDIIVEEKLELDETKGSGILGVEMLIKESQPEIMYSCRERMKPGTSIFSGIELGVGVLENWETEQLEKIGMALGWIYHKLGYKGVADSDVLKIPNNKLVVAESNARKTGGTDLYYWALHTYGKDFEKRKYFVSNFASVSNVRHYKFSEIRTAFEDLLFSEKKDEGVILTGPDAFSQDKLAYFIVAENSERAIEIENEMLNKAQRLEPKKQGLISYVRWFFKKNKIRYQNN